LTKEFFAKLFEKKNGIKLGIGRVAEAFPFVKTRNIPTYHVAGTNGKGTVVYAISHILSHNGLKTGRFISPHIFSYNERISVDNVDINDSQIVAIYDDLKKTVENFEDLSFFEITFLVAWKHFENEKCDRVVIEVGLGGRIDATNVIDWPKTDIITSIGLDHTHILGDTLEKIAFEKLGIIKSGDTVILPQMDDLDLRKWMISQIDKVGAVKTFDEKSVNLFDTGTIGRSDIQLKNMQIASCAVSKTEKVDMPDVDSFTFPGRFEEIEDGVIIDVAHNPPAIKTLADHIALKERKIAVIYGAMKDKDLGNCLTILSGVSEKIFPVSLDFMNRGASVDEIISRSDETVRSQLEYGSNDLETLKRGYDFAKEKGLLLLITGSFYTIEKFVKWRKDADLT